MENNGSALGQRKLGKKCQQLVARREGEQLSGGKEMLIQQGAESFRLWTQQEPDLDAMRNGFELPPGGVEV